MIKNLLCSILLLLFFSNNLEAQQTIDINVKNESIEKVLKNLKKKYHLNFFYSNNLEDLKHKVTIDVKQVAIKVGLSKLFENTDLAFKFVSSQILIKRKDEIEIGDKDWVIPLETMRPKQNEVNNDIKIVKTYHLSGQIVEKDSKEVISNALLISLENKKQVLTNSYGLFNIYLPLGKQHIVVKAMGMITDTVFIDIKKDTIVQFSLSLKEIQLPTIFVNSDDAHNLMLDKANKSNFNQAKPLAVGTISNNDLIDNIKLQPGVNMKNEGSTGYIVRGGGLDQNLILLDGAPVLNESHFLGLVSVFNTQAIKSASLYKGGIPVEFGGRLSSILDIHQKEGSMGQFQSDIQINPIISSLTYESPLIKDTCAIFISGRSSMVDLLMKKPLLNYLDINKFNFYDINGKLNYKINKKHRFYLSGYSGKDRFSINSSNFLNNEYWGNTTISTRLNSSFSKKIFGYLQLIYSDYHYSNEESFDDFNYSLNSNVKSTALKYHFNYYYNPKHKFSFGTQIQFNKYLPGKEKSLEFFYDSLAFKTYNIVSNIQLKFNSTGEHALYFQDEYKFSEKLNIMGGIRWSIFHHLGKGVNYSYMNDIVIDSINMNGIYNVKSGIEPRFKINFKLDENKHINFTYDRTYQYQVLASNSISRSPTDVWVPVSNNIEPLSMNQLAINSIVALRKLPISVLFSVYYKNIKNAVDFIDNAYLTMNKQIETQIKQGKANGYGIELSVQKIAGKFTFMTNYQLNFVKNKIDEINNGVPYFASQDKRHNINCNVNYQLTSKIHLQTNFVYNTGTRTTLPIAIYEVLGQTYTLYGQRNEDQLPSYHRLDVSCTYKFKSHYHYQSELSLSIYNVYNRKNPYSISFEQYSMKAQYNYLLPFLPSMTFKIHLK